MAPGIVEDLILVGPHHSLQEMLEKVADVRLHHVRQPQGWPFRPHSANHRSCENQEADPTSERITTIVHDLVSQSESIFFTLAKIYQQRSPDRETEEMDFALGILESYRHAYLDLVEGLARAAQADVFDAVQLEHQDAARVHVIKLIASLFHTVQGGAFDAWPQKCDTLKDQIHAFSRSHLHAYREAWQRLKERPNPEAASQGV